VKAVVCDIDGVILKDDRALPGAHEFVASLLSGVRAFVFLTNYSSQTPADIRERFLRVGLDVPADRFYTSAMATAEFLNGQAGDKRRAYVVGERALVDALCDIGFSLVEDDADYVVLGETRSFNFDMIQRAARLVSSGARFVATNPDVAGPSGRPSCGALAAPIERITGKQPFYVGKPNAIMIRAALRHLGSHSEETCIVGDNMETDIIAGIQSGLVTILVLSGVSQDLSRYAYRPHHVLQGVGQVAALLEALG
jgi:NagD protein